MEKAYNIKPDSRIAYWIAYSFAQEDSIQQCLFYLSKSLDINPKVLDSLYINNIETLRSWAKERDYNAYEKFSLSLSYKSDRKNFPIERSSAEGSPYFLKRVTIKKDTIPPPSFKITKAIENQKLNE